MPNNNINNNNNFLRPQANDESLDFSSIFSNLLVATLAKVFCGDILKSILIIMRM